MSFDETNKLRSEPYEDYFGVMEITDKQKERRIRLAEQLEDGFLYVLSLIAIQKASNTINWGFIALQFENVYMEALKGIEDDYLTSYVQMMSRQLADSTERHIDDNYYTSFDRARLISENEANTIINHLENQEAIAKGYAKKTWLTMRDKRVRHTHEEVEGVTIPIDEPFIVGGSLMYFPRDTSVMADYDEICNCRCSLKYK